MRMLLEQIKNSIFVLNSIKMKRFLCVLACFFALNGCDDGDLTLETINFEDVTTQSCTAKDVIYKLKQQEALLLEIPKSSFKNEPTAAGAPTLIDIDDLTYRIVYRFYDGTVAADNICSTIPSALPNVVDQWIATSGKIQITTTAIKTTNTAENSTRISGYNHNIAFKNITFDKRNGAPQTYQTFPFGDYATSATPLPFGFDKNVEQCPNSKQIYNYVSGESLSIEDIDPTLIVKAETPLNTPRTGLIGSSQNKLAYRLYSGVVGPSYFCTATTPAVPAISEEWNGVSGVAGISGIIEVTTIKSGTTAFKHTIIIKNATLKKGNSDFKLGDNYLYGEFLTF